MLISSTWLNWKWYAFEVEISISQKNIKKYSNIKWHQNEIPREGEMPFFVWQSHVIGIWNVMHTLEKNFSHDSFFSAME